MELETNVNLNNLENQYYVRQLQELGNKFIRIETQMEQLSKIEETLKGIHNSLEVQNTRLRNMEIEQGMIKASMPQKTQWFQVTTGIAAIGAIVLALFSLLGKN